MSKSPHRNGLAAAIIRKCWTWNRGLVSWFKRLARARRAVDPAGRTALRGGRSAGARRVLAASKFTSGPWVVSGPELKRRDHGVSEDHRNGRLVHIGLAGFGELRMFALAGEGPLTAAELRAAYPFMKGGVLQTGDRGNSGQGIAAAAEGAERPRS